MTDETIREGKEWKELGPVFKHIRGLEMKKEMELPKKEHSLVEINKDKQNITAVGLFCAIFKLHYVHG